MTTSGGDTGAETGEAREVEQTEMRRSKQNKEVRRPESEGERTECT